MNIEIKMFGGIYVEGKAPVDTLDKVGRLLNTESEDFFILDTLKGPVLVNKRNILSVRKK